MGVNNNYPVVHQGLFVKLLDPDFHRFYEVWFTQQHQRILICLFSKGLSFGPWGLKIDPVDHGVHMQTGTHTKASYAARW